MLKETLFIQLEKWSKIQSLPFVLLILIDQYCYLASIGDSKAVLVYDNMSQLKKLNKDHNIKNIRELERIKQNEGTIKSVF